MSAGWRSYFDCIYVVNLPHRDDRRREMAEQLARVGLALDRTPVRLFAATRPEAAGAFPSIGARGCFLSHLGVLQDAVRAGHDRIAILEDDVDFIADFDRVFGRVVERLCETPWDIFYGGYRIDAAAYAAPAEADALVRPVTASVSIGTTHFVAFQGAAVGDVAAHLERMLERPAGDPRGGPMHVDGAYSWYRAARPACRTWVAARQLAVQRPSRTDIHPLRWYDRMLVVRGLAQRLRRLGRAS